MSTQPPDPNADTPSQAHEDEARLEEACQLVQNTWTRYAIRCIAGIFPSSEIEILADAVIFRFKDSDGVEVFDIRVRDAR